MSDIIALKDLCEIEITDGTHKTPTYSESGYIFLSSKNVTTGEIDWDNVMYIPDWLHNELYSRISPQKDDILLAKNGTTGVAAIVDRDEIFDIYVSLALIRPKKTKILPRYLLHAINSEPSKRYFDGHLKGIGVPNLHLTHIRETPIKVPNFEKQISVVNELDKVTNLINKRKEQLKKLDELVKARFVELFGDCNKQTSIKESGLTISDGNYSSKYPRSEEFVESGIPFIRANNLKNGTVIDEDMYYITPEKHKILLKGHLKPNDVLITTRGNIGQVAIVPEKHNNSNINAQIVLLRDENGRFIPQYLLWALQTEEAKVQYLELQTGTALKQLPVGRLEQVEIKEPPIAEQEQFAAFVKQTDKSKLEVQKSLEKLELLKKALMQKYFG